MTETPATTCKFCGATVTYHQADGPFPGGYCTDDGWGRLCLEAPDHHHDVAGPVHESYGVGTTYNVWDAGNDGPFVVTVSSGGSHLKPVGGEFTSYADAQAFVTESVRAEVAEEMGQ